MKRKSFLKKGVLAICLVVSILSLNASTFAATYNYSGYCGSNHWLTNKFVSTLNGTRVTSVEARATTTSGTQGASAFLYSVRYRDAAGGTIYTHADKGSGGPSGAVTTITKYEIVKGYGSFACHSDNCCLDSRLEEKAHSTANPLPI